MKLIDKFIIYSSVFCLFSEDLKFNYIIDIKLFYVIVLINFTLLLFKNKLLINKNLIFILGFFLTHGLIVSIIYSNPISSLIPQLLGISISSIFFYSFLKTYGVEIVFNIYLKMAFIIAFLAIPMFVFQINTFADGSRLNGILTEPAHYAAIMLPAVYIFLREKKYYKFTLVLITIFLSKSSIGYFGFLLILILPLIKTKYFLKYFVFVSFILASVFFYLNSKWDESIKLESSNVFVRRAKQTYESFGAVFDGKFNENTNLSSYALLSNAFVTQKSFSEHFIGTGLGSYSNQYDKYYPLMEPPDYVITLKQSNINKQDANSLFFRMLVDLGIFSFMFIGFFLYKGIKVFKKDEKTIQQSTFFYLIVKLIREGHYFPPEFYFFLLIFVKDFDENTTYTRRFLIK